MFVDLALQQAPFAKYRSLGSQAVCLPTWDDRLPFACYVMRLSGTMFKCRCLNPIKCVPMREGLKVAVLEEVVVESLAVLEEAVVELLAVLEEVVVEVQPSQTIATDPTTTLREMYVFVAAKGGTTRTIARRTAIDNRLRGSCLSGSLLDTLLLSLLRG
jgi:hypothetical protein